VAHPGSVSAGWSFDEDTIQVNPVATVVAHEPAALVQDVPAAVALVLRAELHHAGDVVLGTGFGVDDLQAAPGGVLVKAQGCRSVASIPSGQQVVGVTHGEGTEP
jgi:hypothetical protein